MENEGTTVVVTPPEGETPPGESEATAVKVGEAKATAEHAADAVKTTDEKLDALIASLAERDKAHADEVAELRAELAETKAAVAVAVVAAVDDTPPPDADDELENSDTALVVADTVVVSADDVVDEGGEREHIDSDAPADTGFKRERKRHFVERI